MYVCLANFLKTNLTKFAVIWVKRCQKAGFLSLRSSKITVKKEKERRKRKSEENKRRKREKHNGCTLCFYNSYVLWRWFLARKNCWTQKVHFTIMLSKIRPEDPAQWAALMPNGQKWRLPLQNGTLWKTGRILWKHSSWCSENQPNKICSHSYFWSIFVAFSPTAACSLLLVNNCCGHWTAVVFIKLLCGLWTDCLFWTTHTKHIKQGNNANGSRQLSLSSLLCWFFLDPLPSLRSSLWALSLLWDVFMTLMFILSHLSHFSTDVRGWQGFQKFRGKQSVKEM